MSSEWRKVAEKISNWGRWGKEDQLGTLNYITPAKIASAAATAKQGKLFPLSIPLDAYGPQGASGFRRNPIHIMSVDGGDEHMARFLEGWGGANEAQMVAMTSGPMRFTDDFIIMPLQGSTQWDALSHVYYDGQLYNGYPAASVTSFGATKDSIDQVAGKGQIVSRAVLLDVARHRKVNYLPPQTVISPEELDDVAKAQKVTVESGDIILIRTGWRLNFLETKDGAQWLHNSPGLSWRCAEWLHNRQAAAIASDNIAVEVTASEFDDAFLVFHMLALRDMGMMLGEIWDLEALGADCAADGVYAFLLVAQPLRVTGGVGSPVNPIAIK
ncbi:MAG TPA: cyclase family protein [Alphaproteobacteria bacterium]|nr:cyclase family protein [Alphaproteobacteria bacterium]